MGHMERVTFVQGIFCGVLLSILLAMVMHAGLHSHAAEAKSASQNAEPAHAEAR